MKLSNTAYVLAALSSATHVLADEAELEPTKTVSEVGELWTPEAGAVDLVDLYGNHLDLRQATDYLQGATQAATQAGAVTTFYINKSVGATVTYAAVVYTQTFADVPDQLPSPIAGTIGYGNLVKQGNGKRDAQPNGSPVVLAQEQVAVTLWQQPVKQIKEVVIMPVTVTTEPSITNPPEVTPTGSPAWSAPYSWNSNATNQTNMTGTGTVSGTATAATAKFIFPSQMNPWLPLPPYDDYRN